MAVSVWLGNEEKELGSNRDWRKILKQNLEITNVQHVLDYKV
jgi:hypothetical protein